MSDMILAIINFIASWTCTPTMYPASYIFKDSSAAYVTLAVLNIFFGIVLLFVTFILDYFEDQQVKKYFIVCMSCAIAVYNFGLFFTTGPCRT